MRPALTNALTNAIRSALSYTANEAADAEQWVAQLDGAMQSWIFSTPVQVQKDDIIKFKLNAEIGSLDISYILQSSSTAPIVSTMFYSNSDGKLTSTYMISVVVNGNSGVIYIEEGGNYVFELTYDDNSDIEKLFEHRGRYTPGSIYDFEQIRGGVTILKIPLTNKAQGATQLATVGNINAFMPNYTDAVWRKP